MKIYDLSKELFSAWVFPGDPVPEKEWVSSMEAGASYNLTRLTMGSHNGTHMDAPLHFCAGGRPVDQLDLEKCVGPCKVIAHEGKLLPETVTDVLADGTRRLLIRGEIEITLEAAEKMAELGLWFLGVEGPTVGAMGNNGPVHVALLKKEVAILEAALLKDVPEGNYFLVSAPLKLGGVEGAPARPLLLEGIAQV